MVVPQVHRGRGLYGVKVITRRSLSLAAAYHHARHAPLVGGAAIGAMLRGEFAEAPQIVGLAMFSTSQAFAGPRLIPETAAFDELTRLR
ncbi:hypothetical protein ACFB49_30910 [Sphingomonas sp. DBB INV C78]